MKEYTPYNVTVCGIFAKEIRVLAESEDDALNYAQDICDRTDLVTFTRDNMVDIAVEDVAAAEDTPFFGMYPDCECCD